MTLEEPKQAPEIPTEYKYADGFEFLRIGTDFYHLLIQTQIAIINLQTWCLKWQISINISKTNYIIFYDKKKLPLPPSIPVTIDGSSLTKVKAKRVLGIIIDEDLTFTPHIEHITQKCKIPYNRLSLYPDLSPQLALQLYKTFIRAKLEFGCTVWGFRIHNVKHLKLLESAQKGATSMILKTMKSTPTDALKSELSILPIDQRYEAVNLLIKEDDYIQSNMIGRNKSHKIRSPFENLRSLTKQILQFLSQTKKCNVNQLLLPTETPATLEIFHIPNLLLTLPETKLQLSVLLDNLGHWYQQNRDRFCGWVSSIKSWPNWIWCDHQENKVKIVPQLKQQRQ